MKLLFSTFLFLFSAFVLSGCSTSRPIKTTLDLAAGQEPSLNYSSEKDVIYEKTIVLDDGTTETTKFQALSSAPAMAQAERERVQAEANAKQAEALSAAVSALAGGAERVLIPTE